MAAEERSFDLHAIAAGVLAGLVAVLTAAVVLGVVGYRTPLLDTVVHWGVGTAQGLAAWVAGFQAARRAGAAGWLHGALAGLLLLFTLMLMGLTTRAGLPAAGVALQRAAWSAVLGAVGGMIGVSFARRRG